MHLTLISPSITYYHILFYACTSSLSFLYLHPIRSHLHFVLWSSSKSTTTKMNILMLMMHWWRSRHWTICVLNALRRGSLQYVKVNLYQNWRWRNISVTTETPNICFQYHLILISSLFVYQAIYREYIYIHRYVVNLHGVYHISVIWNWKFIYKIEFVCWMWIGFISISFMLSIQLHGLSYIYMHTRI